MIFIVSSKDISMLCASAYRWITSLTKLQILTECWFRINFYILIDMDWRGEQFPASLSFFCLILMRSLRDLNSSGVYEIVGEKFERSKLWSHWVFSQVGQKGRRKTCLFYRRLLIFFEFDMWLNFKRRTLCTAYKILYPSFVI